MDGDHQIGYKPTKFCRPDDWADFGRVCACGKPAFLGARQIGRVPRHAGNLEHPKKAALDLRAVRLTIGETHVGHLGSGGSAALGFAEVALFGKSGVAWRCALRTSANEAGPAINSIGFPSAKALASGVKSPVVTMMTAAAW